MLKHVITTALISTTFLSGTALAGDRVHAVQGDTMITVQPSFVPAGVNGRYHYAVGDKTAVFGGGGAAMAVLSAPAGETVPLRLRGEAGFDAYLDEVYSGMFIGTRAVAVGWTSDPLLGGSNVQAKLVAGGRARLGESTSLGIGFGLQAKHYFTGDAAGMTLPMPALEIDIGGIR